MPPLELPLDPPLLDPLLDPLDPPLDPPLELPLEDPEPPLDPPLELPEPEELPPSPASPGTFKVWPPHAQTAVTAIIVPSSRRMSTPHGGPQQLGCQRQVACFPGDRVRHVEPHPCGVQGIRGVPVVAATKT
jgi:hypothetical protein